MKFSNLKVS